MTNHIAELRRAKARMKEDQHTKEFFQAESGYFALDRICYEGSDRIEIQRLPVLFWCVKTYSDGWIRVDPVTYAPLSDLWQDELLMPDGTVTNRDGAEWKSLEAFAVYVNTPKGPNANVVTTTIMDRAAEVYGT